MWVYLPAHCTSMVSPSWLHPYSALVSVNTCKRVRVTCTMQENVRNTSTNILFHCCYVVLAWLTPPHGTPYNNHSGTGIPSPGLVGRRAKKAETRSAVPRHPTYGSAMSSAF